MLKILRDSAGPGWWSMSFDQIKRLKNSVLVTLNFIQAPLTPYMFYLCIYANYPLYWSPLPFIYLVNSFIAPFKQKLLQKAWLDTPFPIGFLGFLCTVNMSLICHSFCCFKILYLSTCLRELNSSTARGCHVNDEACLTQNLAHVCSQ